MRVEVGAGDPHDFLERGDRVALRAKVERDEIGLAIGQHRDRRRRSVEIGSRVKLGQR